MKLNQTERGNIIFYSAAALLFAAAMIMSYLIGHDQGMIDAINKGY